MTPRVIFVDDEEHLVWSLLHRVKQVRPDLTFEGFVDPREALARIEQAPPQALVTDMRMPGMSGVELLMQARSIVPGLPVVVATALGSSDLRAEIDTRGSVEYLEKPYPINALLAAIDAVLARRSSASDATALWSLPEIVQLHALARFTGALQVASGTETATLHFVSGEIHHARCGTLCGADAVYAVLAWQGGSINARNDEVTPERSVALGWQQLLMEGCQRLDASACINKDNAGNRSPAVDGTGDEV